MIVNVWGPPGSGKSRHSEELQKKFGCSRVLDEYHKDDPREVKDGDLLLSQQPILSANVIHDIWSALK